MNIDDLRKKIDEIDDKFLLLLNKRAKIVKSIGELKKQSKLGYFSPAREKRIIQRLLKENKGPLSSLAIKNIFKEILSSCLALEKPIKIAYLGPPGTFTHMAVLQRFGLSAETYPKDSIGDVFLEVERKTYDFGVVPIENSTEGVVNYTLDMFINSNLFICAEIYLSISHHLLGCGKISEIEKIYSNPQAFSQCKNWLKNNIPAEVEMIETPSTTRATEISLKDRNSASIASKLASQIYNVPIISENIQDNPQNKTRFLVIGLGLSERSGKDKTSLMFSVQHKAGALHRTLSPLNKHQINMTMIESRPAGQKPWEYVFFVDIQGYHQDEKVLSAIVEMEKSCYFVRTLGSYPEEE